MHDETEKPDRLNDLNQVLIEYSVFLSSMERRRELLIPLMEAGITDAQLRTACAHMKKTTSGNPSAQIVEMIRDNPKLQAVLQSSKMRRQRKEGPGARDRRENMDRELSNPLAAESRMAMRAWCALKYGEARDVPDLARQMGITEEKVRALEKVGAAIYGHNRD